MADHTYEELKKKTVAELREIAKSLQHDAVKGHSQLNKEHLLPAVCQALGIDAYEHHHVVGAFDKSAIKAKMRSLRADRQVALEENAEPEILTRFRSPAKAGLRSTRSQVV